MTIAVGLVATLLIGFVLGRLWEIRQRIMRTEAVEEQPHRIVSSVVSKGSEQPPRDDSKLLAALDRELKGLLKAAAVQGQSP